VNLVEIDSQGSVVIPNEVASQAKSRERNPYSDNQKHKNSMECLSLVTGIFRRCAPQNDNTKLEPLSIGAKIYKSWSSNNSSKGGEDVRGN